jgi:hypothetical protein
MKLRVRSLFSSIILLVLGTTFAGSQTNVVTWHNDNLRDGLNSTETILNQTDVNPTQFGKLCSAIVDGQVYGQPLVVSNGGVNTIYVATQNDSVYAINGSNCTPIANVSLLEANEEAVQCTDVGGGKCHTVNPIIGILGTPVIDIPTNTIYLISESESTAGTCGTLKKKAASCFAHRFHALDLTTLAEKFNGPVAIAGTYQGVVFSANTEIQRPGLLELSGVMANGDNGIYVGFSEIDGAGTPGVSVPHGWIFGFDALNLATAPLVWSTTPNGEGGGLWASGAGLAAGLDTPTGSTNIYVVTGDGDFTANTGGADYGDSFVKLTTGLVPSAYFTPYAQACMNISDQDFGSGGVMLTANTGPTYYAVAAGKQGTVFAMNLSNPGGYTAPTNTSCPATGTNANAQSFAGSPHPYFTTPASWKSQIYYLPMFGAIARYNLNLATPPTCLLRPICTGTAVKSTVTFQYGTNISISASGTTTGTAVLWAAKSSGWPSTNILQPATLYAFDAEHTVSKAIPELWDSTKCPTRDQTGNAIKFVLPTIANGAVYLGTMDRTDPTNTRGELDVFGLTSAACN